MSKTSQQVTNEVVKKVAKLAKINIHEDEIETLRTSMDNILDMIQQITDVETVNVCPTNHTSTLLIEDVEEDVVVHTDYTNHMNMHFTQFSNGFFQVPNFISED